jgi:hypothetical protein
MRILQRPTFDRFLPAFALATIAGAVVLAGCGSQPDHKPSIETARETTDTAVYTNKKPAARQSVKAPAKDIEGNIKARLKGSD